MLIAFYVLAVCAVLVVAYMAYRVKSNNLGAGLTTLGLGVGVIIVCLLVQVGAAAIIKNNRETYYEYWNGSETSATTKVQKCSRDGWCHNTYSCDPYTVTETYTVTNSDGKTETRTRQVTKYHSCPYSEEETSYYVATTVGDYTIANSLMTGKPWRWGVGIPGGQITEAPIAWSQAKARIDAGEPGPATSRHRYKNYILADQNNIMKKYSDQVDTLTEKGLLPPLSTNITNQYRSDKAYFMGTEKMITEKMQNNILTDLEYLNAFTGSKLGADVRLVFVDSANSGSMTNYTNAVHAYWQSDVFKKDALPKNAAVVTMGVRLATVADVASATQKAEDIAKASGNPVEPVEIKAGSVIIDWADFFTGMPVGNENVRQAIKSNLPGVVITDSFIGKPIYNIADDSYKLDETGTIQHMFSNSDYSFERISMSAADEGDKGTGFKYLSTNALSTGNVIFLLFLNLIIFAFGMFFVAKKTVLDTY